MTAEELTKVREIDHRGTGNKMLYPEMSGESENLDTDPRQLAAWRYHPPHWPPLSSSNFPSIHSSHIKVKFLLNLVKLLLCLISIRIGGFHHRFPLEFLERGG